MSRGPATAGGLGSLSFTRGLLDHERIALRGARAAGIRSRSRYDHGAVSIRDHELRSVVEASRAVVANAKDVETIAEEYSYASLPLCVIDSVYSIGVRYEGVRNVVQRYCAFAGVPKQCPVGSTPARSAQQSITAFLTLVRGFEVERLASEVFANRQRTSARNGILKADAVVRFADVLARNRIEHQQDVLEARELDAVERGVHTIPGQSSGLSWRYFLMLAGREDLVKPDRMILRYLERVVRRPVSKDEAQALLLAAANELSRETPGLNARALDHMIWAAERER